MYGQIRTFGANTQHIYSNLTPEWADKAVKAQAPDLDAADPQYKRIRDSVMQQWFVKAYDELNAVGLLEVRGGTAGTAGAAGRIKLIGQILHCWQQHDMQIFIPLTVLVVLPGQEEW